MPENEIRDVVWPAIYRVKSYKIVLTSYILELASYGWIDRYCLVFYVTDSTWKFQLDNDLLAK